jgi:hypothetical protein
MKKIIILVLILILIPSVCLAGVNKDTFKRPVKYNTSGMVYLFIDNAPIVYPIIRDAEINSNYICEVRGKAVGLVNRGKILEIHIRIPLKDSYVRIYYQERFYDFKLEPYQVGQNYILFIFRGDI